MSAAIASSGSVKIIHGANDGSFAVVGTSVASVQASLVDAFNIPLDVLAFVNGKRVRSDFRLRAGFTLEFVKHWGRKGQDERVFQPDIYRLGDPCPYLLTEDEAIRYLRLDTIEIAKPQETLRRYRDLGLLRATQISKRLFYLRKELDQFILRITERNAR